MTNTQRFQVNDIDHFRQQVLNWASRFNIFVLLDSCGYSGPAATEPWMLAAGVADECLPGDGGLNALQQWLDQKKDWVFGNLGYDVKNQVESVHSNHPDHVGFPDIYFFQPAILVRPCAGGIEISTHGTDPSDVFSQITATNFSQDVATSTSINIQQRFSRSAYIETVEQLRRHILRGDCYEINFCQEFFAEDTVIDPVHVYRALSEISPTPFSAFYRYHDKYALCASPERFLKRTGNSIMSQPIKGTIGRDTTNSEKDAALKAALYKSEKDRSENVMVVDLVRNDLSRICVEGTVRASELYGIYTFPQVHQMISTIEGTLPDGIAFTDIIRATFPMGSMTGAPKLRVMQLAEQYEKTKRGIYSGSIGYIAPGGDFDFNVVIRSILYNAASHYVSYQVGGGITFYSDPQQEYEECLLKASAIKKVLQQQHLYGKRRIS